jgi:hypothetical protein
VTTVTAADRLRSAWPWVAVAAAVLAVVAVSGNQKSMGPPLDPSATSPQGAKALRLLLENEHVHVDVSTEPPQGPQVDTTLILRDQLSTGQRDDLTAWVNAGGTLVVADPSSELAGAALARAPGAGGLLLASGSLAPSCDEPAFAGIAAIDPAGGGLFRIPPGSAGCFTDGQLGYVVLRQIGNGNIVSLAGPALWTNAELGKLDNSALATALLAPRAGARLTWLKGTVAGGGHRSLIDLIPGRVTEGLVQLLVAFALLALWRGRRLGRPVLESQPVELPGSELVVAVGNLLHRGARIDQAAGMLRSDLARVLGDRLGVGAGASAGVLADVATARTGLDRNHVHATLAGPPPVNEAGLIALAQSADAIRQEVAHAG